MYSWVSNGDFRVVLGRSVVGFTNDKGQQLLMLGHGLNFLSVILFCFLMAVEAEFNFLSPR